MKIPLTDKLFIESDRFQYILKEKRTSEEGKYYESNLGYYGTIKGLVRGLLEKGIKSDTTTDLVSLKNNLTDLESNIVNRLDKIISMEGK